MKILFPITAFYPSQVGGPCNSVYFLAKAMANMGHEIMVLTTSHGIDAFHDIPFDKTITMDGFKVIYSTPSFITKFFQIFSPFSKIPKNLKLNINNFYPDVVHFSSFFDPIVHLSIHYLVKKRIPYIISPRGELGEGAIDSKRFKKKVFLSLPTIKRNIELAAKFHVTAVVEKNWVDNVLIKDMKYSLSGGYELIPNMVSDDLFILDTDSLECNFDIDGGYILFLSRIARKKNIELLIKSFAKANIDKRLKLVIAGWSGEDPLYTKELKKLCSKIGLSNKVIFTDKVITGTAKRIMYRKATLFVLPSHSENFGMVVLESLAQGTPVIASNGTPWEILEKYNCGYWVDKNSDAIIKAIEDYMSKKTDERERMSKNAIELAGIYKMNKLAHKYIKMYESTIDEQK